MICYFRPSQENERTNVCRYLVPALPRASLIFDILSLMFATVNTKPWDQASDNHIKPVFQSCCSKQEAQLPLNDEDLKSVHPPSPEQ